MCSVSRSPCGKYSPNAPHLDFVRSRRPPQFSLVPFIIVTILILLVTVDHAVELVAKARERFAMPNDAARFAPLIEVRTLVCCYYLASV